MRPGRSARARIPGMVAAGFALAMAMLLPHMMPRAAWGQDTVKSFGGFSGDSNAPIDIKADMLEVQDANKIAIFSGNVVAVQGKMTIRSKRLKVKYTGERAGAAGAAGEKKSGGSQIISISAEGKVLIETGDDQTTTSDQAFFDVIKQTVTISGNVVLSQGENVIKGDQLVIDLKTNLSRFVNRGGTSKPQRVHGLFMPQKSGAQ